MTVPHPSEAGTKWAPCRRAAEYHDGSMSTDGPSGQPDEEPDRPREDHRPGEPADHGGSVRAQPETRSRQEYYDVLASGRSYEIVSFTALIAERPASERHEWQVPLNQGGVDRCGLGVIDERAKRFSPAERRIAETSTICRRFWTATSRPKMGHFPPSDQPLI
jgi:hypothetical protein